MDLVKIGKYLAEKRKGLGMTQKQVAEQLGMSDKSVSKWERGVCLPDVSLYEELCALLGVSLNEFLAGEDIPQEDIVRRSEDNLIAVTKDSKHRQRNLRAALAVVCAVAVLIAAVLGYTVSHTVRQPRNFIYPAAQDGAEMKTAQLLSGTDGAFLFHYSLTDEFSTITVYCAEYRAGELVKKEVAGDFSYEDLTPGDEGMIALVPDPDTRTVQLILADNYAKLSADLPILEEMEGPVARSATQMEEQRTIEPGEERGLVALYYSRNGIGAVPVKDIENGDIGSNYDYMYYFSVVFGGETDQS